MINTSFLAHCRTGKRPVEAWANKESAVVVVHPLLPWEGGDPPQDGLWPWLLSHRHSGLSLDFRFDNRAAALNFAAMIEDFDLWNRVPDNPLDDWNDEQTKADLKAKIDEAYAHWRAQHEAEAAP